MKVLALIKAPFIVFLLFISCIFPFSLSYHLFFIYFLLIVQLPREDLFLLNHLKTGGEAVYKCVVVQ